MPAFWSCCQPLEGDLRGGAHEVALHARILLVEAIADGGGRLGVVVGRVAGELLLLLRRLVERLLAVEGMGAPAGERHRGDGRGQDQHAYDHSAQPSLSTA